MRALLSSFSHDRATYPNEDVYKRKGVVKFLLEEYEPLLTLVENLEEVETANLTRESNRGPDALITFASGRKLSIQITVANESKLTAYGREQLIRSGAAPVGFKECRDKREKGGKELGRALRTREGRLREQVTEVLKAIKKKATKAIERKAKGTWPKTDVLLVWTEIRRFETSYQWREELTTQFKSLGAVPYPSVYVANGNELITLKA